MSTDRSPCCRSRTDLADAPRSAQLSQQAYTQLRLALPIAAEAAYRDGQWQALMTTVSESNRVPETTLVPALAGPVRRRRQLALQSGTAAVLDSSPGTRLVIAMITAPLPEPARLRASGPWMRQRREER